MLFKLGIMTAYLENEADEPSIPTLEKQHRFVTLRGYVGERTEKEKTLVCSCGFIRHNSQLSNPATFESKFGQCMRMGKPGR